MRKVVKKARSATIRRMPALRQPMSTLVKFTHAHTQVYRMSDSMWPDDTSVAVVSDNNPLFPADGIEIRQNDLFDPIHGMTSTSDALPEHANGFLSIGEKYGKYRVVGAKTTIRVRRMGAFLPTGTEGWNQDEQDAADPTGPSGMITDNEGHHIIENQTRFSSIGVPSVTYASAVAAWGSLFDPTQADPLLCFTVDRTAYQDVNSAVSETDLKDYPSLRKHAFLKGIKYRELKAGSGTSCTLVHKYSERYLRKAGNDTDYRAANTGSFPRPHLPNGTAAYEGSSPTTVDTLSFKIKPYDDHSHHNHAYKHARVMVCIDQEFLVKCFEPKYSYASNV